MVCGDDNFLLFRLWEDSLDQTFEPFFVVLKGCRKTHSESQTSNTFRRTEELIVSGGNVSADVSSFSASLYSS